MYAARQFYQEPPRTLQATDPAMDELRTVLYRYCFILLVMGCAWPLIFAGFMLAVGDWNSQLYFYVIPFVVAYTVSLLLLGLLGLCHYKSIEALRAENCCSPPLQAVRLMHQTAIAVIIGSFLCIACACLTFFVLPSHSSQTAAIFLLVVIVLFCSAVVVATSIHLPQFKRMLSLAEAETPAPVGASIVELPQQNFPLPTVVVSAASADDPCYSTSGGQPVYGQPVPQPGCQ